MTEFEEKIACLRQEMKKEAMDFYMVTTEDAYMAISGVVHDFWRSLRWLTGFTGSSGYTIITEDQVGFWTDSRYHLQAAAQVQVEGVQIYNVSEVPAEHYLGWISSYAKASGKSRLVFGVDGRTISTSKGLLMQEHFDSLTGVSIVIEPGKDLIDRIWKDRPEPDYRPIWEHDIKYAGKTRKEKEAEVRREMEARGAQYYVVGGLEGPPWLTNMRGYESISPIFASHMVVTPETLQLFCKVEMIPEALKKKLIADGYTIYPVEALVEQLRKIPAGARVYMDPSRTNYLMPSSIPEACVIVKGFDIVNDLKAVKNPVELQNIRRANIMESIALFRMFRYLREHVGKERITEYDTHLLLEEYRKRSPEYIYDAGVITLSAGYGKNGAWPHYAPTEEQSDELEPSNLIVVDACSHYICGSVDMCRTIYLGPSEYDEQIRKDYAVVLKAFIAICRQVIRKGTNGQCLDSVARTVMWNHHLQYGHGTGHGLGYCNCLHEGPQTLAEASYKKDWAFSELPLKLGNTMALEPGVYREGKYGMRVEDNLVIVPDTVNEFGEFYRFDNMFYHPLEREIIEPDLLHDDEVEWINAYHAKTFELLSPHLEEEEVEYLRKATAPIFKSGTIRKDEGGTS